MSVQDLSLKVPRLDCTSIVHPYVPLLGYMHATLSLMLGGPAAGAKPLDKNIIQSLLGSLTKLLKNMTHMIS